MMNPQNITNGVGKVLETFPQIYEDGLKETVVQTGKVVARIPRFINALASTFDLWLENREKNVNRVSQLVDEKMVNIPEEKNNITAPLYCCSCLTSNFIFYGQ